MHYFPQHSMGPETLITAGLVTFAVLGFLAYLGTRQAPPVLAWTQGTLFETDSLGTLRVGEQLGVGRNALVLNVSQEPAGLHYAAKVRDLRWEESRGQLAREAAVLTALNTTDGFPRIYGSYPGRGFFVMELLEDAVPLSRFARGEFPLEIHEIVTQLISRLEAVHAAGFIHADVHRRNVLVSDGKVFLIDFGLALSLAESRVPQFVNLFVGSVHEQMRDALHPVDDIQRLVYVVIHQFYADLPWADLYSLRDKLERDHVCGKVCLLVEESILMKKLDLAGAVRYFAQNQIPQQLRTMLKYVSGSSRKLDEPINYAFLKSLWSQGEGIDETDLPDSP